MSGTAQVQVGNVEDVEVAKGERVFADLTPYAAFKVTNVALRRAGVDATVKVTSQSMYGRASKGVIKAYRTGDTATWMFDGASFAAWLERFVDGYVNGTVGARVDYDALADAYI